MLSSAVYEIYPANKSLKILAIANSFLLNIAEHDFCANRPKYENANYCHAQPSFTKLGDRSHKRTR